MFRLVVAWGEGAVWAKEHQEAFVEDRMLRILQGDVRGVVTGMRRMATQRDLKGRT